MKILTERLFVAAAVKIRDEIASGAFFEDLLRAAEDLEIDADEFVSEIGRPNFPNLFAAVFGVTVERLAVVIGLDPDRIKAAINAIENAKRGDE